MRFRSLAALLVVAATAVELSAQGGAAGAAGGDSAGRGGGRGGRGRGGPPIPATGLCLGSQSLNEARSLHVRERLLLRPLEEVVLHLEAGAARIGDGELPAAPDRAAGVLACLVERVEVEIVVGASVRTPKPAVSIV